MRVDRDRAPTQKCHIACLLECLPQRQRSKMKLKAAVPLAALGRVLLPLAVAFSVSAALAETPARAPMDLNPPAKATAVPPASPNGSHVQSVAANPAIQAAVDPNTAIQKANAYFNGAATMVGDFVQVGADGRRFRRGPVQAGGDRRGHHQVSRRQQGQCRGRAWQRRNVQAARLQ